MEDQGQARVRGAAGGAALRRHRGQRGRRALDASCGGVGSSRHRAQKSSQASTPLKAKVKTEKNRAPQQPLTPSAEVLLAAKRARRRVAPPPRRDGSYHVRARSPAVKQTRAMKLADQARQERARQKLVAEAEEQLAREPHRPTGPTGPSSPVSGLRIRTPLQSQTLRLIGAMWTEASLDEAAMDADATGTPEVMAYSEEEHFAVQEPERARASVFPVPSALDSLFIDLQQKRSAGRNV
jgi:hypothetical protein